MIWLWVDVWLVCCCVTVMPFEESNVTQVAPTTIVSAISPYIVVWMIFRAARTHNLSPLLGILSFVFTDTDAVPPSFLFPNFSVFLNTTKFVALFKCPKSLLELVLACGVSFLYFLIEFNLLQCSLAQLLGFFLLCWCIARPSCHSLESLLQQLALLQVIEIVVAHVILGQADTETKGQWNEDA